jgi:hypothetical protein
VVARIITILRLVIGAAGIWFGFYMYFDGNLKGALDVVVLAVVAVVGVLSFLSHFVFYRADAARLGWHQDKPYFQWEVGYANLAFALVALLAYLLGLGIGAEAMAALGYGLYLLQTTLLHGWRCVVEKRIPSGYFFRSVVAGLAFAVCLLFFAAIGLAAAGG